MVNKGKYCFKIQFILYLELTWSLDHKQITFVEFLGGFFVCLITMV